MEIASRNLTDEDRTLLNAEAKLAERRKRNTAPTFETDDPAPEPETSSAPVEEPAVAPAQAPQQ